jgi:hypothetical protein
MAMSVFRVATPGRPARRYILSDQEEPISSGAGWAGGGRLVRERRRMFQVT